MRSIHFFSLFLLPFFSSCQQAQEEGLFSFLSTSQDSARTTSEAANIVFQSTDGGQTWQDISAGLPKDIKPWLFFASEDELFLGDDKGNYKNNIASKSAHWEKEISMEEQLFSVSASPGGAIAIKTNGQFFQKLKGTDVWLPIFTNFKSSQVRGVFTAENGSIFITSDDGLFKSTDQGNNWKHVVQDGWVLKMAESDGVLLCTNQRGILRSTDGGEHWDIVLSKGGVGIDVKTIKGGFASIAYEHGSESRRIHTSTDGGQTWQPIDAELPPSKLISSILQVGETFYCGHPKGIYRSADGGKTWNLLVPTIGEKVFNLSEADGVMYAVLRDGGC